MTCRKLKKDPTDLEKILAKAFCYAIGQNKGIIVKEEGLTLLVSMNATGKIQISDVTEKLGDLEEGSFIEFHETMGDAVTSAALHGGSIRE